MVFLSILMATVAVMLIIPATLVDIENANLGQFSLPCIDDDGDGFIDVPVIVAYKQSTGTCGGVLEAYPANQIQMSGKT